MVLDAVLYLSRTCQNPLGHEGNLFLNNIDSLFFEADSYYVMAVTQITAEIYCDAQEIS